MKVEKYIEFCRQSMGWNKEVSEKATRSIMNVIGNLTSEAERVSTLSTEALKNLNKIRDDFERNQAKAAITVEVRSLTDALKKLGIKHSDLAETISPIIEALQFQDRIAQNMDNLANMIATMWQSLQNPDESLNDFGLNLLKLSTIPEEREIIYRQFPDLEKEETTNGDDSGGVIVL